MNTLSVPTNLTLPELAEWMNGAGYTETFVLTVAGHTHHTFTNTGDADGAPDLIGIIEVDGAYTVHPQWLYDEAEHAYSDGCDCDVCMEVRAEDAALRRGGM